MIMLPAHKIVNFTAVHVQILKFNLCRTPVQKYSENSMLVVKGGFFFYKIINIKTMC